VAGRFKVPFSGLSGSYIPHFASSMIMIIPFMLAVTWLSATESEYSFRQDNYRLEIAFILTALISFGWLMSMVVGIVFDLFPLTHDSKAYTQTHSNQYLLINIIGQALIMGGIFSNNLSLMFEMATIGLVLLSWGLISIAWPSWRLHLDSIENEKNCGNVALAPALMIPVSVLIVLACWIFRKETGLLEFGFSFNVVVMMGTIALTLILAHFNRRLSWDLVKYSDFRPVVAIYLVLALVHCFSVMMYERGQITENLANITQSLPFFWAFVSTRPLKMLQSTIGKNRKPHSALIGQGQMYFLIVGIMSIIPDFDEGKFINISYVTLIFSTVMLSIWGSGLYLHYDHLHKSIHNRSKHNKLLIFNGIGVISLFMIGFRITVFGDNTDLVYYFMRNFALFSMMAYMLITMFRDLFLSLDTWHRVPMHYERYVS
tara:strand:+ start:15048 stop:16337 length:1290 start_codon:yes stop_codon:yes gene_type:complete